MKMKREGLAVRNLEQLKREASLLPLLKWILPAVAPGRRMHAVHAVTRSEGEAQRRWVCLLSPEGEGLAATPGSFEPSATSLQAGLAHARLVARLSERLDTLAPHEYRIEEIQEPPLEWSEFLLEVEGGSCAVACAPAGVALPAEAEMLAQPAERRVRVRVIADGLAELDLGRTLQEIPVRLPELRKRGALISSLEGGVIMRIDADDDVSAGQAVRVRIEIGEMELGLRELLSLRPGSTIELGAPSPLPCALVVGASTMARGAVEAVDDGLRVRLVEIVE